MKKTTSIIAGATATLLLGAGAFAAMRANRPRITGLSKPEGHLLLEVARKALDTAIEAFDVTSDDPHEFDRRDGRAQAAGRELEEMLEAVRPKLGSLEARWDTLAQLLQDARLALMAFAINRKNRGTPDAAQTEAEASDRKALRRDAEPIFAELAEALA